MKNHTYHIHLQWTGNQGSGTSGYKDYSRSHLISSTNKTHDIYGSSDPSFRGDPERYNPEELFVSSIASCHMLWSLHLCSANNVVVSEYTDKAKGIMIENKDGSGQFSEVVLYPKVLIQNASNRELASALHHKAHEMCFIANSCNFKIQVESEIMT